ncbi:hypothetical protein DL763_005461 [Monosporascus cannonballus]|nr:hypothetical protein DL763_005461 [Monosporascus cannonballus]
MEGIGVAASIIAIIEFSAKIASLCVQYSSAVKDANNDIARLQKEVRSLNDVLREVERLLDSPDSAKLSASQKLHDALNQCSSTFAKLKKRLDPGKTRKFLSYTGIRKLKWPFKSKEVEKDLENLERCKQTLCLALQVDQTALIRDIHQKIDLAKLPFAEGASFDSHSDEHDTRCHPGTRTDLLRQITEWARDPQGKCIFWLNGMAGTGKSTVSRTVAQSFASKDQLGASFFFKRGEGDRGNAARFFTTITAQLVLKLPGLIPYVRAAIEADPTISGKELEEQFEKLIFQPFSEMEHDRPQTLKRVIVIDALDECEREEDIGTILRLLSRSRHIGLQIFVTSKPELPIRLGFRDISGGTYQELVLHEIPQSIIEHDISAFLRYELAKIRDRPSLPPDWPGETKIQALVRMATPLFIFAATVCRFIGDRRWNPDERLATVLKYQAATEMSKLDRTYLPILDQLFIDLTDSEREKLAQEFREIIGSIVVLADPLSSGSLASLLGIPKEVVDRNLDPLHSVLSVPSSQDSPLQEFAEFVSWLDQEGHAEALCRKFLLCMAHELENRKGEYGDSDWRAVQCQMMMDLVGDMLNLSRQSEADRVTLCVVSNEAPSAVSRITEILEESNALPMHRQVELLLRLAHQLRRVRQLTDPLELLFNLILQKSSTIPVYALIAIGEFCHGLDKYDRALKFFHAALVKVENREVPVKYLILNSIGRVHCYLGHYQDAEGMFRQAAKGIEKTLGLEHKNTLESINYLGDALYWQEKYAEAEEAYRRAAKGREKTLGLQHEGTLESINNLENTLFWQDEGTEAEDVEAEDAEAEDAEAE